MSTPQPHRTTPSDLSSCGQSVVRIIKAADGRRRPSKPIQFVSHPLARALKACGTSHIYADTADWEEMYDLLVPQEDGDYIYLYSEVDGNTTNQPLVVKVLDRFVSGDETDSVVVWVRKLQEVKPDLTIDEATVLIYSMINGRLGLEVFDYFATRRMWQISLELHTALADDPAASKRIGWYLRQAVPHSFVKVPFTPNHPHALLIARDLEQQGIPVNFTTTFSARQAVAAALLANPHRTNVFLGRLSQGLDSELLGEYVVLETQRHITALRRELGIRTLNMLASVRRWQTMVLTAGCDVYTVPYSVLNAFFTQEEIGPEEIRNCVEADYSDRLEISETVRKKVGPAGIKRLYQVEPEFVEFLTELRETEEYRTIDGEGLFKRFDRAGFSDFFYAPSPTEWRELRRGKLPNLDSSLTQRLALDTLYSLLAVADFTKFQEKMDETIRIPIQHLFA